MISSYITLIESANTSPELLLYACVGMRFAGKKDGRNALLVGSVTLIESMTGGYSSGSWVRDEADAVESGWWTWAESTRSVGEVSVGMTAGAVPVSAEVDVSTDGRTGWFEEETGWGAASWGPGWAFGWLGLVTESLVAVFCLAARSVWARLWTPRRLLFEEKLLSHAGHWKDSCDREDGKVHSNA